MAITAESLLQVTAVLPTFNGATRIPCVLAALSAQNALPGSFEIVVVDNGSTDGTAMAATTAARDLGDRGIGCRLVAELRQGLTYARIRGVLEASAPLVAFLDDDNIPAFGYIAAGIAAFADPSVGLAVSSVHPQWEVAPPPSIARRRHLLAVNDYLGEAAMEFGAAEPIAPTIGAGLWVRHSAFLAAVPCDHPERLMPDRLGGQLVSSGDIEIGLLIGRAGFRRIYEPTMRVVHEIPRARLGVGYFCRLIEGVVRSELTLRRKYRIQSAAARERPMTMRRLACAMLAAPAMALSRPDGLRDALFMMAERRARWRGPMRGVA
jgi:glycosyltransferase involved in cell wall biosynthesis